MEKFPIVEEFKRTVHGIFVGMAIPHQPSLADGVYGPIRSEKVLKFNRTALRQVGKNKVEKNDPRYNGGEDLMRVPVGKPGSAERLAALVEQYASLANNEVSPFSGDE
jgi:hypothetical protein